MSKFFTRARGWALVVVCTQVSFANSQSLETFAGGRIIDNLPATQSPITSGAILTAVDGSVYVVDIFRHKLMRRDPTTGILTRFPAGVSTPPWNTVDQVFRSVTGINYVIGGGALYQLFLPDGQINLITRLDNPGSTGCSSSSGNSQFAADWNGTVYFTDPARNSVCKVLGFNSIQRIAGADAAGFAGDGGAAQFARFNQPVGLALDGSNHIFIADYGNNRVRRIDASTGIITTFVGNGTNAPSGENVNAATSSLAGPTYLAIDNAQTILITEAGATRVRSVNPFSGQMKTLAGNGQQLFDSPDGGLATQTALAWPSNVAAFMNGGDYLISDLNDARMRQVSRSTGIISTLIGNGSYNFCGESAPPRELCMDQPRGVAVGANDDVYIADVGNRRIRKYSTATGLLTTIAGRDGPNQYQGEGGPAINAIFGETLAGLSLDAAGNIFVAVGYGERVTRIDNATGIITTVAGSGLRGFAGDGGLATAARTNYIASVAVDGAGNIFLTDKNNHRVRKVAAASGIITTVAGNGLSTGALGDNGPATSASLAYPDKVGFDHAGNLLIADSQHSRIRRVNKTTGIITTVIGNGSFTNSGDGGQATSAGLNGVKSFAVDPSGNIFVVSQATVRRVDVTTGTINKIPNLPTQTPEGFWIIGPDDLALDSQGRLYMSMSEAVVRANGIPPLVVDSTPPVVVANWSGGVGTNGWFRGTSPVTVQFQWWDFESNITSISGTCSGQVNADTAGTTFTCSVTSAGGTTTQSFTVKRDSVAPTLVFGTPSPAPDATGWNSTDVSVPFTASDALSGVFTTSTGSPVSITGTGTGLTTQVVVTDVAGNTATFTTPAVKIDRSAPVVTANVSGTLGLNDWYTSDVQVSWTTVDTNSSISTTEGCETNAVLADAAGVTFTCTATSAGGTATKSVTIKRDATAPQLVFGTTSPAPVIADWYGGEVTIPFTTSDATSGVATTSKPNPLVITGPGYNLRADVVVTDAAGNSATFTTTGVSIDTSPPVVDAQVSGTLGNNGWYVSDVQVTWSESEDSSPVVSREGCFNLTLSGDAADATYSCTVNSVGGSTTRTITIKRDATPPWVEFNAITPEPNGLGWYNSDVSIHFISLDHVSGVVSTSVNSPALITGEGAGLTRQIVVTDAAGNTASFATPAVSIDRSAPTVTPLVTGTPGNNGWFKSDVQVSWAVNESPGNIVSQTGCGTTSVTADTAGVTFVCNVVSGGGSAGSSVTIKRDATAPVVTFGTITPAANVNGWNKTNLSVPFTRSDALSGLASTSATSPMVLSTEAAGVTAQVTVVDLAGNSATFTSTPRNIDKTAPYAEMETPEDGATYGFYANVTADFVCEDLSLVSCTAPVAQGAFINTASAGSKTFKVTAKDQALFTTNHTHSYTVASGFDFDGFLAPLRAPNTLNVVTRGSLVPLRWRLPDGRGGYVTNPASFVSATVSTFTCSGSSVTLNDLATGPEGLGFDAASGTFTYNWQTNAGWTGCRKVVIKLKDNSTHEARFKLQ